MPASLRELVIFLGSPGDCADERELVRRVADEVTKSIGVTLGVRLRVEGWESVMPDLGRPQSQINPMVDECDVFIGLLGHRWGTPTGTHTSGFLEEYERAAERRQEANSPQISLYFRSPAQAMLEDPGPELTKVLDFKQLLRDERELLYKDFDGIEELERQIWPLLTSLAVSAGTDAGVADEGSAGTGNAETAEASGSLDEFPTDDARNQAAGATDAVTRLLRDAEPATPLDTDRLVLLSHVLGRDAGLLPVHTANRLFLRRNELQLLQGEASLWLRTILRDEGTSASPANRVVPGWLVIKPSLEELVGELKNADEYIVAGVFRVLERRTLRPDALWLLDQGAEDRWVAALGRDQVKRAATTYLANQATAADLPLLESILQREESRDVQELKDALTGEYAGLVASVSDRYYEPEWKATLIGERFTDLGADSMRSLAIGKHTPEAIRRKAISEYLGRQGTTDEDLVKLLSMGKFSNEILRCISNPEAPVSAEQAQRAVDRLNDTVLERHELRHRIGTLAASTEDLLRQFEADDEGSIDAWWLLGWKTDPQLIPLARDVYDTDAARLTAIVTDRWKREDLVAFVRDSARIAALRILTQQAPLPDEDKSRLVAELDRGSDRYGSEPIVWMATIAEDGDLDLLINHLPDNHREGRSETVAGILRIGGSAAARRLLETAGEKNVPLAAVRTLAEDPKTPIEELRTLLYSPSETVRMTALSEVMARDEDFVELLRSYPTNQDSYFYNVVCELDEALARSGTSPSARRSWRQPH